MIFVGMAIWRWIAEKKYADNGCSAERSCDELPQLGLMSKPIRIASGVRPMFCRILR